MRKSLRSKEEVARSESRAQPARSRVLLSLSARRGYIFYESPEVSSRGRDEEVEITSRRGGIKCKKQEEREKERTITGGVGVPWKRIEMRRTDRRMDSKGLAAREKGDREEDRARR